MIRSLPQFRFKEIFRVFLFCLVCAIASPAFSQTTKFDINNLSNVRVDDLNDDQIRQFAAQVQAMGLSDSQLEQMALARGMSPVEIQKLRMRLNQQPKTAGSQSKQSPASRKTGRAYNGDEPLDTARSSVKDTLTEEQQAKARLRSRIFGANLFAKGSKITFEPNMRLATPKDYQLGPDDQLLIDISGFSEASYQLTISPEGRITVPYVDVIQVGGTTIEQATNRIRTKMTAIYPALRTGDTYLNIALGNVRSIKVIMTGELVTPGTYTISSLATVFNALYLSGGPTENGSFRQIEIIRAGRKIATLDLYDFLLTGSMKTNMRLQDQDVIYIPVYRSRMEIVGEVKRQGLFEMLPGETFNDLLRFAGGFTESAFQKRVKVLKNTEIERRVDDITSDQFPTYRPSSGDKYLVETILDRFQNRVTITGAVFRPGIYQLTPGITVKQLIQNAEGLREDAFQSRGYITRLKDDMQTELQSFDIGAIMSGRAADIPLKREDVITISSIFDLKELYNVQVDGEVQRPGTFNYAEGMTLEDVILQAGGLKESATNQRIEVSRRVKNSNALSTSAQTSEVYQVNIEPDLKSAANFVLQPFDIVVVRSASGYEVQRKVWIEGEVLYPGIYTIRRKDERISDLIARAGGFTAMAYAEGASLQRPGPEMPSSETNIAKKKQEESLKQFQRLQKGILDEAKVDSVTEEIKRNTYVGIDLPQILKKPGQQQDLFLEEGDILTIPKQLQTIKINGEVLSPVTVRFSGNKGFKSYISNAGGFTQRALKQRSYVVYANGSVKATKKFLVFNNYPRISSGAEIFVPKKEERRKLTAGELIGLGTGIASLGALIIGVISSLNK